MIKKHIPKILDYIYINTKPNTIIVYKGFSNEFINDISNKYPYLFDNKNKFNNGKIDLKFLKDQYKNILLSIDNFDDKKILLYEELILLNSKNINIFDFFNGDIIVFENNIMDFFPNQSNYEGEDIEENIDNELEIDDNILYDFYSNFTIISGKKVIQYKSIQEDLELLDFYKVIYSTSINDFNSNIMGNKKDCIIIGNNEKYYDILFKLFDGEFELLNNLSFVFDEVNQKQIIYNIFLDLGIKVDFYKNSFENYIYSFNEYRSDFNILLKKYWGYDDFRKINFNGVGLDTT